MNNSINFLGIEVFIGLEVRLHQDYIRNFTLLLFPIIGKFVDQFNTLTLTGIPFCMYFQLAFPYFKLMSIGNIEKQGRSQNFFLECGRCLKFFMWTATFRVCFGIFFLKTIANWRKFAIVGSALTPKSPTWIPTCWEICQTKFYFNSNAIKKFLNISRNWFYNEEIRNLPDFKYLY